MSSNNPFASALNDLDSYVHHRDPPPPPSNGSTRPSGAVPSRPPKPDSFAPPPSYEEVASPDREYPKEKSSSSSSRYQQPPSASSRQSRSHSDTSRHRSHRSSHHHSDRDRDRERRHHKSSRNKSPSKKKPEPVKAKNLDTIDKLDVTAFFGGGFHHDGPFDACTPHRNKNIKQAPVMAFPVDGPNNSIKGLAPTSKDEQMNLAFGNYEADQNEIINRKASIKKPSNTKVSTRTLPADDASDENLANPLIKTNKQSDDPTTTLYTPKQNPSVINFDANRVAEPIHGSTTAGLGSSTFLDGAPAPKINDEYLSVNNGGLGRKKSLVQRLRKNSASENSSRRNSHDNNLGRTQSPPSRPSFGEDEIGGGSSSGGNSLLRRVKSLKVGGRK